MPTKKPLPSELWTLEEASQFTRLAPRTLRRHVAEGRLRAYRLGRTMRFSKEDVMSAFTATDSWAVA